MPTGQFNELMKGVVDGTPQAKAQLQQLAAKVRQDLGQSESDGRRVANNLLDGE